MMATFMILLPSMWGVFVAGDLRIEEVTSRSIEIKFDKWLGNLLQQGGYPDFAGNTEFKSISSLSTKANLFSWNKLGILSAKSALEGHFRRQAHKNQPQYKIYHIGPIISYHGDEKKQIILKNMQSNQFDQFKNPEFDIKARKQSSVAEELTCNGDIAERNDIIYYINIGFEYETLSLTSDFGVNESSVDGILKIALTNLTVKAFLRIKEIDSTENFRCKQNDNIFPTGFTHRVPEYAIKYNLNDIQIDIEQLPSGSTLHEVNHVIENIKNEILRNKETTERRIWAYLLPNFTKYVTTMESVKNVPEILYHIVQNHPNPIFSYTDLGQQRNNFLDFD